MSRHMQAENAAAYWQREYGQAQAELRRAREAIGDSELEQAAVDMFAGYHLWSVVSNNTKPLFDLLVKRGLLRLDENDSIKRT